MAYNRSVFPEGGLDIFQENYDPSPYQLSDLNRWQTLKSNANRTSNEEIEFQNLTTQYANYIYSPEKLNFLQDVNYNLENFFKNNTQGYINNLQSDSLANFNAQLSKYSDKGIWSNTTTYQQWNTTSYSGQTYRSKQDGNLNNTPIGGENDIWWVLEAKQGAQGVPGIGISMSGIYNNAVHYTQNQAVTYNGSVYYALQDTIGNIPSAVSAYWGVFQANVSPIIQSSKPINIASGQVWIHTYND